MLLCCHQSVSTIAICRFPSMMNRLRGAMKALHFAADKAGYAELLAYLHAAVEEMAFGEIHVGMEATGHYWLTLYSQFSADGLGAITVINSLQTKAFQSRQISLKL